MKKLMKAIAFATVMCMLLSTAAFAATTATNNVDSASIATDKKVTVNVTGAEANAQVALVVVAGEENSTSAIAENNIEYIDQQPADESGDVTFGPITTKNEVEVVSVFVGYANATAQYVGTVALEEEETVVTISKAVGKIVSNTREALESEDVKAEALIGAGATVTFTIPADYTADKMIWSLTLKGQTDKRFSAPVAFSNVLGGDVKLAVAFRNGNIATGSEIAAFEIDAVDAIFHLTHTNGTVVDGFTDVTDANRMAQNPDGSEE